MKPSLNFAKDIVRSKDYPLLGNINCRLERGVPGEVNELESVVA